MRNMENTNCFFPVPTDLNEQQTKMDPRAWLLKLVIVRIELQQKYPTFSMRFLPPHHPGAKLRSHILDFLESRRSHVYRLDWLASEMAALEAFALLRVDKIDNLLEVLAQAIRSIRKAFLHDWGYYLSFDRLLDYVYWDYLHSMAGSRPGSKQEYVDTSETDSKLAIADTLRAFLTLVLHLLTSVFQYLIGYVDRGGSKTYSSGAFDFRDSFVSPLLFQAAYVWIKFQQAARPGCHKRKAPDVEHQVVDIETGNLKGIYRRSIKEKSSGNITRFKYEPRFTPPRQEGDDGTDKCSKRLPLGEYHTLAEAHIVLQIARHYYDKDGGCVELEGGRYKFLIPPMSERERGLAGEEKRKWVSRVAKQVGKQMYAEFQREKGKHSDIATVVGSHGTEFNDPSSSAVPLACPSLAMLTTSAAEPAIASSAPSSPSLPLVPFDGVSVGDAYDSCESLSGFEDMVAELFNGPGFPNLADHQSSVVSYQMHYQGFAQLLGDPSLLEVGALRRGIEYDSEPELNLDPSFQEGSVLADAGAENIEGSVLLPRSVPDLYQLLLCQKCLEVDATQFMDHKLKAYQMQISKLHQEKEQLRSENESLKSKLEQVAKAQVATWTGMMLDIQQRD